MHTKQFKRPIHGVVMRAGEHEEKASVIESLKLKLRPGHFFSRRTAAVMHGMPIRLVNHDELIEVGAVSPLRPLRRPQVRGHELRAGALASLPAGTEWLPSVEETWCLLAQVATKRELLAAGDFLVSGPTRFEQPASTIELLREAAGRFAGCSGARIITQVLPLIREGVESAAESALRLLIVEAGFLEPETCCEVVVDGRVLHSDLGYSALKIAIEYEGAYHFAVGVSESAALEQARKDVSRVRLMQAAGWVVLRATSHDLRDPRQFLADLTAAIAARRGL